jgi:hypothetical protein
MTSEVDAVYGNQKERNLLVQPGNESLISPRVHDYSLYIQLILSRLFLAVLIRPFQVENSTILNRVPSRVSHAESFGHWTKARINFFKSQPPHPHQEAIAAAGHHHRHAHARGRAVVADDRAFEPGVGKRLRGQLASWSFNSNA